MAPPLSLPLSEEEEEVLTGLPFGVVGRTLCLIIIACVLCGKLEYTKVWWEELSYEKTGLGCSCEMRGLNSELMVRDV